MAENALAQQEDVIIATELESLSSVTKKVQVTVPVETINQKTRETMTQIRKDVVIPGFRRGRVPNRVLEKKLGGGLNDEVRNHLVEAALRQAISKYELKVVGQPRTSPPIPELPANGPMEFSIELEVAPEFPLPDLASFEIFEPQLTANDERFNAALGHLQKSLGTWENVSGGTAAAEDRLTVDVNITTEDGTVIVDQKDATIPVAAGSMAGVQFDDLGEKLTGLSVGDSTTLEKIVPDTHRREDLRGRKFIVKLNLKAISRLNVPELTDELAIANGFDNLAELRESMRSALESRIRTDTQQAKRNQLVRKLVDAIQIDLPPRLTQRMNLEVFRREATDLINRGVPVPNIEKAVSTLQDFSHQEAEFELRQMFILSRLAIQFDESVSDQEVNAAITQTALLNGERPEVVRRQMEKMGQLEQVAQRVLEHKVLDRALLQCKVTPVDEATWKQHLASNQNAGQIAATPAAADAT